MSNIKGIVKFLVVSAGFFSMVGCTVTPGFHVDVDLLVENKSFDIIPQVNVRYPSTHVSIHAPLHPPTSPFIAVYKRQKRKKHYTITERSGWRLLPPPRLRMPSTLIDVRTTSSFSNTWHQHKKNKNMELYVFRLL